MGTKKGGARKGKPKGSRLAFDDTEPTKEQWKELFPHQTKGKTTAFSTILVALEDYRHNPREAMEILLKALRNE